jgi:hypothetical protein
METGVTTRNGITKYEYIANFRLEKKKMEDAADLFLFPAGSD